MKIVVLAGGNSPEREVSLSTGSVVANALMENGHEVMLVDLLLGNKSVDLSFEYRTKEDKPYSFSVKKTAPDIDKLIKEYNITSVIGEGVIDVCKNADVVFNALHGGIGENGSIQTLFELYGIKYTGSNSVSSMLSMDKDLTKMIMDKVGVRNAKSAIIYSNNIDITLVNDLNYPLVVKPCSAGSSVGITIVNEESELISSLKEALKYEDKILVEEFIKGREFSVGVLDWKSLAPIEIKPLKGFYDYENKYQSNMTLEICPADITSEQDTLLKENALKLHNALGLGVYSRTDFILTEDNLCYALETNSLPGMTPTSLLPQEAKADGISFNELVEIIVKNA